MPVTSILGPILHASSHLIRIPPGKLQQKASVERNNRTIGQDRLDLRICEAFDELQQITTEWLWSYNHERLIIGNGSMPPPES